MTNKTKQTHTPEMTQAQFDGCWAYCRSFFGPIRTAEILGAYLGQINKSEWMMLRKINELARAVRK